MPERRTIERARKARRAGKAPTTQAGEFVREEIHHIRQGKHGARSAKQAIAIGLSKARRAGVPLRPPGKGQASAKTRQSAERDYRQGQALTGRRKPSPTRSRAVHGALEREGRAAGSRRALAKQGTRAARQRTATARSAAARKAVRTKGPVKRRQAARKAVRTRRQRGTRVQRAR